MPPCPLSKLATNKLPVSMVAHTYRYRPAPGPISKWKHRSTVRQSAEKQAPALAKAKAHIRRKGRTISVFLFPHPHPHPHPPPISIPTSALPSVFVPIPNLAPANVGNIRQGKGKDKAENPKALHRGKWKFPSEKVPGIVRSFQLRVPDIIQSSPFQIIFWYFFNRPIYLFECNDYFYPVPQNARRVTNCMLRLLQILCPCHAHLPALWLVATPRPSCCCTYTYYGQLHFLDCI